MAGSYSGNLVGRVFVVQILGSLGYDPPYPPTPCGIEVIGSVAIIVMMAYVYYYGIDLSHAHLNLRTGDSVWNSTNSMTKTATTQMIFTT